MRDVQDADFAKDAILSQFEGLDFKNPKCSPLVNGGCGLGKTTALVSDEMYELFQRKLEKENPQVVVIESRSVTRDQQRLKSTNANYTFLQFENAVNADLSGYDVIIVDEAHSLFTDSEFATRATAPLCQWLRDKCKAFQIYITASDIEFIQFAEKYFIEKEFVLTYPDLEKANVRFLAQEMVLSINTKKTRNVIAAKEAQFFVPGKRGLFFVWSAAEASELYRYYSSLGYNCGFYISQHNDTQIVSKEKPTEDDDNDFFNYASRYVQIDVFDLYNYMENERKKNGAITIRESLLSGKVPEDIDYLFLTSVGQEGISLDSSNKLDFIFIEDTYPLTINQKIFRYRDNVPFVYLSLPQRRLEKMLIKTLQQLQEMQSWSQDRLRGFYEGSRKDKFGYGRLIWKDENGVYKIAENYIAYALTASKQFRTIRDNKDNFEFLRETYGQYAKVFRIENLSDISIQEKVAEYIEPLIGQEFDHEGIEKIVQDLKDLGVVNKKKVKDYSFPFIKQYCKDYKICTFSVTRRTKNGVKNRYYKIERY